MKFDITGGEKKGQTSEGDNYFFSAILRVISAMRRGEDRPGRCPRCWRRRRDFRLAGGSFLDRLFGARSDGHCGGLDGNRCFEFLTCWFRGCGFGVGVADLTPARPCGSGGLYVHGFGFFFLFFLVFFFLVWDRLGVNLGMNDGRKGVVR